MAGFSADKFLIGLLGAMVALLLEPVIMRMLPAARAA